MSFKVFITVLLLFFSSQSFSKEYKNAEETTVFSGRIVKINKLAKLIRVKINFENSKYLNKRNRVEFWNASYPGKRCLSYLAGRTSDYLLIKIPNYKKCVRSIYFTTGSYIQMYSPDLESNLATAKELVDILLKKQTALQARAIRQKRNLEEYIEKVDVVNKRYEVLRQKLELEWQKELYDIEEDKSRTYQEFKQTELRLNELEFKLEQYRVRDQNLKEERWSLDPKLYYKK